MVCSSGWPRSDCWATTTAPSNALQLQLDRLCLNPRRPGFRAEAQGHEDEAQLQLLHLLVELVRLRAGLQLEDDRHCPGLLDHALDQPQPQLLGRSRRCALARRRVVRVEGPARVAGTVEYALDRQ